MSSGSDNGYSPAPSSGTMERLLTEEEMEPYVRRKKSESSSRKRLKGLSEEVGLPEQPEDQNNLREQINSRERKRMHDLNDALRELRTVLPYKLLQQDKRMSKIDTLLLAKNCISLLQNANERLQSELDACRSQSENSTRATPAPIQIPSIIKDTVLTATDSMNKLIQPKKSTSPEPDRTVENEKDVPKTSIRSQLLNAAPATLSAAPLHSMQQQLSAAFPHLQMPMIPFLPFLPNMAHQLCRRPLNQPCNCINCFSATISQQQHNK